MDEKISRNPGGRLALWLFYGFCVWSLWVMARYFWVVSSIDSSVGGDMGSTSGKWLGALLGFMVLGSVGALLGWLAWYTRPRGGPQQE
ncbi:cell division protein DrpB [Entomohabitans teleogrylli]|uniref:cell division protein DrpB n=1 Tax=Entomohabitans teleogrylli TaxID=1384589 RepID=UPI00073D50A5|nr:cell division protein DrpB [Entomohabitans teleogrylli]